MTINDVGERVAHPQLTHQLALRLARLLGWIPRIPVRGVRPANEELLRRECGEAADGFTESRKTHIFHRGDHLRRQRIDAVKPETLLGRRDFVPALCPFDEHAQIGVPEFLEPRGIDELGEPTPIALRGGVECRLDDLGRRLGSLERERDKEKTEGHPTYGLGASPSVRYKA